MSKKVNFAEIIIRDINGKEQKADVRQLLGNLLYMQGNNIEECELGSAIYHQKDDEPLELDVKQAATLTAFAERVPYVMRQGIKQSVQ